jgi:hypothetical protein
MAIWYLAGTSSASDRCSGRLESTCATAGTLQAHGLLKVCSNNISEAVCAIYAAGLACTNSTVSISRPAAELTQDGARPAQSDSDQCKGAFTTSTGTQVIWLGLGRLSALQRFALEQGLGNSWYP